MKPIIFLNKSLLGAVLVSLAALMLFTCAPTQLQPNTPAPTLNNPATTAPNFTSTPQSTSPVTTTTPNSVPAVESAMPTPSLAPTSSNVSAQLVATLELAANEMRAAESAGVNSTPTLAQAQLHAEAAVNILVGKYGRWYGDQNGDNQVTDPSDKRGVLPGETSPVSGGADLDNAQFPYGLAIMAIGTQTNSPALAELLGDAKLWRTKPRAGYDAIARTIAEVSSPQPQLTPLKEFMERTLDGTVPRTVAYARLILTSAKTVDDAHQLAAQAVQELGAARQAAQTITP